MRVLITGGNGFTGRILFDLLKQEGIHGYKLGISSRNETDSFCVDLRDEEKLTAVISKISPDVVVHLAGTSFANLGENSSYYENNVIATDVLLRVLSSIGTCRKVILASSAQVYKDSAEPLSEGSFIEPSNHYGLSKLAMEKLTGFYPSMNVIVSRCFNYTGVGQRDVFLVPKIAKHFREKRESIQLGNLEIYRDFTDVRDICDAYLRLITSDIKTGIFNICSGRAYHLGNLIEDMSRLTGHKLELICDQKFVRDTDRKKVVGSYLALQEAVGWEPRYTMDDTLVDML